MKSKMSICLMSIIVGLLMPWIVSGAVATKVSLQQAGESGSSGGGEVAVDLDNLEEDAPAKKEVVGDKEEAVDLDNLEEEDTPQKKANLAAGEVALDLDSLEDEENSQKKHTPNEEMPELLPMNLDGAVEIERKPFLAIVAVLVLAMTATMLIKPGKSKKRVNKNKKEIEV